MYGGIDQLVDTYKGNPQPLQAEVQKAQQNQPPGEIPADLEEALALQEIAELRTGAQNQQAMQAGGAQPSVVDKLKQMLAGYQAQAQMAPPAQGAPAPQGQPVMAARGGSIDQLMSNLGRHYAGGGIVAFSGKDSSQFVQDIAEIPQAFDDLKQRAREEDARRAAEDRRMAQRKQEMLDARQKTSLFNYLFGSPEREKEGQTKLTELSNAPLSTAAAPKADSADVDMGREGRRTSPVAAGIGTNVSPNLIPASARPQPVPAAPRPPTANVNPPAAPAAEKLDPNSLRGLTEAYIKNEFGLSPEAERDKAVDFTKKTMGLDALLGEKERRAFEREEMIKQAQADRQPTWIAAFQRAGKADPRTGLGGLLAEMGAGNTAAIEAYRNQDLAFQKELAQLRDIITDAKIDGNKELVKQGMAAYKEVDARRRAAATNATSLVATDERTETSKQIAKDAAATRLAIAAGRGTGSGDKQQLNELKALQTSLKDQLKEPRMMGKAGDDARRQLGIVNAEIAKMAGLSTMAAAPGAASPGGTSLKYNPKTGKIE